MATNPIKDGPAFLYCNAGRLFDMACKQAESIKSKFDTEPTRREALISTIFAAISLEAFINELGDHARMTLRPERPQKIAALATLLAEAEDSRAQVLHKYQIAKFVLSGEAFDRGAAPYQDAATLVERRNALIHAQGESSHEMRKGKLIASKSRMAALFKGVIATQRELCEGWNRQLGSVPQSDTNWLDNISTKALAVSSCKAVAGMVIAILDVLPRGEFADEINGFYRRSFTTHRL